VAGIVVQQAVAPRLSQIFSGRARIAGRAGVLAHSNGCESSVGKNAIIE